MNKFYLIMTLLLLTLITPLWGQSEDRKSTRLNSSHRT